AHGSSAAPVVIPMKLTRVALFAGLFWLAGCGGPSPMNPDSGTVTCTAGTQGCPCASGDVCGKNSAGEQLVCEGGLCETMTCPIGSSGCACRRGTTCDAPSDSCTN